MHSIKNDLHILEETSVKRVGGVGGKYNRLLQGVSAGSYSSSQGVPRNPTNLFIPNVKLINECIPCLKWSTYTWRNFCKKGWRGRWEVQKTHTGSLSRLILYIKLSTKESNKSFNFQCQANQWKHSIKNDKYIIYWKRITVKKGWRGRREVQQTPTGSLSTLKILHPSTRESNLSLPIVKLCTQWNKYLINSRSNF